MCQDNVFLMLQDYIVVWVGWWEGWLLPDLPKPQETQPRNGEKSACQTWQASGKTWASAGKLLAKTPFFWQARVFGLLEHQEMLYLRWQEIQPSDPFIYDGVRAT